MWCLFGLSGSLCSSSILFGLSLGADTNILGIASGLSEGGVDRSLRIHLALVDGLNTGSSLDDGEEGAGLLLYLGLFFLGGFSGLGLLLVDGEEDELRFVFLQSLNVHSEGLLRLVGTSVVHCNSNGKSQMSVDSSFLELFKSESASKLDLHVVFSGRGVDDRSESTLDWLGEDSGSLRSSCESSVDFLGRLVEPCLHFILPFLLEVILGDSVVSLGHLG